MKKFNLTLIAAITALFIFGMIAFQADTTEAGNNYASPSATPRKQATVTNLNANVKVKPGRFTSGGIEHVDNWDERRKHRPRKH